MSTTPTTVGLPAERWTTKQYAIVIALALALVAGVFAVYALTRADAVPTAPSAVVIEEGQVGGDGCSASFAVGGGLVEGQRASNACGGAGGSGTFGGIQP